MDFALLSAALLAAQAPPPPPGVLTPSGAPATNYLCSAQRNMSGALLQVNAMLELDGRVGLIETLWERRDRRPESRVRLSWYGWTLPAETTLLFTIDGGHFSLGRAELRRGTPGGQLLAVGEETTERIKYIQSFWRSISPAVLAPGRLVLVVRTAAGILAQRRFADGAFAAVMAAHPALRREVETMIADFRQRCRPVAEEIIVTTR